VHPKLVEDKTLEFSRDLPLQSACDVLNEWHDELKEYLSKTCDENDKHLLKRDLEMDFGVQLTPEYIEVTTGNLRIMREHDSRGFARVLIARPGWGSVAVMALVNETPYELSMIHSGNVDFNEEKLKEYTPPRFLAKMLKDSRDFQKFGTSCYAYNPHNTDDIPAALFLRRWAVAYHNECLKQVFGKK